MRLFYALIFVGIIQLFLPNGLKAQSWQSIHKSQTGNTVAWKQFVINPYTNDIWLVNDNKAAVIKNDGSIELLNQTHLGVLWNGSSLRFAFTPNEVFFMKSTFGLFQFANASNTLVYSEPNLYSISANQDTVYMQRAGTILKYLNGACIDSYFSGSDIVVKNVYLYTDNDYLGYQVGWMNSTLQTDPEYLHAGINDKKFQRNTDSLYVGTTKGIMYAYNYDILDTITPNNTSNMPSSNVLELEFDHLDQLWAVFGDAADVPFAIAKLEANNWTNRIDASNAPINFSEFLGLEIDTLGNLWVADNLYIHTLLTANSPGWLGITSNIPLEEIDIIPNPSNGIFQVSGENSEPMQITVLDQQGKQVAQFELNVLYSDHSFDLSDQAPGVYFAHVKQGGNRWVKKLVVR
jgi:hypothetical protein